MDAAACLRYMCWKHGFISSLQKFWLERRGIRSPLGRNVCVWTELSAQFSHMRLLGLRRISEDIQIDNYAAEILPNSGPSALLPVKDRSKLSTMPTGDRSSETPLVFAR